MEESRTSLDPPGMGSDGASRLLSLVDRSAPPHRLVGGLIHRWYAASGTTLLFEEWADPATCALADAFDRSAPLARLEDAVVAFAQARAGADHDLDAVTGDLLALVRLARSDGLGVWGASDPVGLLARAVGVWATEHTAAREGAGCLDPVTGLVSAAYLRARLRELHDQCRAMAIAPRMTFAALVVQLDLASVAAPERIGLRSGVGRLLAARFRSGETVAAVGATRMVAVMPAYGIDRAIRDVASDLAAVDAGGAALTIGRLAFADDPAATFSALAGTRVRT